MKFEPGGNHTYVPLQEHELEDAWDDANRVSLAGAPKAWEHGYRFDPPTRDWKYKLVKYGITYWHYRRMHNQQKGKCAICRGENRNGRDLYVDHCHTTGAVRGLLCSSCNTGLGLFKDDVSVIREAISYLNRHQAGTNSV